MKTRTLKCHVCGMNPRRSSSMFCTDVCAHWANNPQASTPEMVNRRKAELIQKEWNMLDQDSLLEQVEREYVEIKYRADRARAREEEESKGLVLVCN